MVTRALTALVGLAVCSHAVAQTVSTPLLGTNGYLVVRMVGISQEKDASFEFTHQDSGYIVRLNPDTCRSAGANAQLCIVIAPQGRYFWSRYDVVTSVKMERSVTQDPAIVREQPSSADDTFEIAADVINYIGDWDMKITSDDVSEQWTRVAASRRWNVDIKQNPKTLQRVYELFPEYTSRHEIYLSMMGKKAISLQEFLEIVEENS